MWGKLFSKKPKKKFSLENLRYLYGKLQKNPVITAQNKQVVVETLRAIAELMIWGDQHNQAFFDYFGEKAILGDFAKIVAQRDLDVKVKVQILQTLSILVANISKEMSIFYLLSNNHINDMIVHRFDFDHEEIISYYISFLKTLSLKLNPRTIQFFFNEQANDFPLYTEAIKFHAHKESMVRIAVRTLSLNVYAVDYPELRKFVLERSAVPYFSTIVLNFAQRCLELDHMLEDTSSAAMRGRVSEFCEQQLDILFYFQDLLHVDFPALRHVLNDQFLSRAVLPTLMAAMAPVGPEEEDEDEDKNKEEDQEKERIGQEEEDTGPAQGSEGEAPGQPDAQVNGGNDTPMTTPTKPKAAAAVQSAPVRTPGPVSAKATPNASAVNTPMSIRKKSGKAQPQKQEPPQKTPSRQKKKQQQQQTRKRRHRLRRKVALYCLAQALGILRHEPLINSMLAMLMEESPSVIAEALADTPPTTPVRGPFPLTSILYPKSSATGSMPSPPSSPPRGVSPPNKAVAAALARVKPEELERTPARQGRQGKSGDVAAIPMESLAGAVEAEEGKSGDDKSEKTVAKNESGDDPDANDDPNMAAKAMFEDMQRERKSAAAEAARVEAERQRQLALEEQEAKPVDENLKARSAVPEVGPVCLLTTLCPKYRERVASNRFRVALLECLNAAKGGDGDKEGEGEALAFGACGVLHGLLANPASDPALLRQVGLMAPEAEEAKCVVEQQQQQQDGEKAEESKQQPQAWEDPCGVTDALLALLSRRPSVRVATAQLAACLLKELFKPSLLRLAPRHAETLGATYRESAGRLKNVFLGTRWSAALDALEGEWKRAKQMGAPRAKDLIAGTGLLLPQTDASLDGLPLASRPPRNDEERLRCAIQVFFAIRDLHTKLVEPLLKERDAVKDAEDANRDSALIVGEEEKAQAELEKKQREWRRQSEQAPDLFGPEPLRRGHELALQSPKDVVPCSVSVGRRKVKLSLALDPSMFMLVAKHPKKQGFVVVDVAAPLRICRPALNRNNSGVLHVTIRQTMQPHPAARRLRPSQQGQQPGQTPQRSPLKPSNSKPVWNLTLFFQDTQSCQMAKSHLDAARARRRKEQQNKLVAWLCACAGEDPPALGDDADSDLEDEEGSNGQAGVEEDNSETAAGSEQDESVNASDQPISEASAVVIDAKVDAEAKPDSQAEVAPSAAVEGSKEEKEESPDKEHAQEEVIEQSVQAQCSDQAGEDEAPAAESEQAPVDKDAEGNCAAEDAKEKIELTLEAANSITNEVKQTSGGDGDVAASSSQEESSAPNPEASEPEQAAASASDAQKEQQKGKEEEDEEQQQQEESAKAQLAADMAGPSAAVRDLKECSSCKQAKSKKRDFSKAQGKKSSGRCKVCISRSN